MILQLSKRYSKVIAAFFLVVFYTSLVLPLAAPAAFRLSSTRHRFPDRANDRAIGKHWPATRSVAVRNESLIRTEKNRKTGRSFPRKKNRPSIGGPSQPEMSSFKSVGTDNMVNLFTGDFSYNIPLLDVGGYPVNIYYDGGITPEQEASWVGLGWNLNPGNINRNVRGIPDDFNGQDTLQQLQVMKPNKTWGVGFGADLELFGIKAPINAELGVAFNNYLGPSLDLALRGSSAFKILNLAGSEKMSASALLNLSIDVNSRTGSSFSGRVSFAASAMTNHTTTSFGVGLSTGYNSRSGIKALQVSEQHSVSQSEGQEGAYKRSEEDSRHVGRANINQSLYSTSISFVKPCYTPLIRMPVTNTSWSGHFQVGLGSYGVAADVETEVYGQKAEIDAADTLQKKPMVGYLYAQNAVNNPGYVMDFTRFNDKEVTPNTPVISVPQYTYDVFSIQGEGTGGSIRAFRNDLGYIRDNITTSKDKNSSIGGDIDPPGHYGGNFNTIKTPSTISEWNTGNKLRTAIPFTKASNSFENVYFRNPGENCVTDPERYLQVGGTDLVRFVLGGSGNSPTIEPKLQSFSSTNVPNAALIDVAKKPLIAERNKRTQVISFLTAAEASVVGLDTVIKSYDNQTFLDNITDTLKYERIPRVDGIYRKSHHISQINVTENNGRRYVYGVPVYNLAQKDFTFSVDNSYSQIPDKINVSNAGYPTANSLLLNPNSSRDGYVQVTTTPPYAHSFLLSGILSPDYVDVTGNGITEDDMGTAVKFNYTRIKNGTSPAYKWRAPLTAGDSANFNAGLRSEVRDDKAMISYGERESWYLHSIESKTMIALFYVSSRLDGRGAKGPDGIIDTNAVFLKRLDSIALFNKADLKENGLPRARPIKTVVFDYIYKLCQNTPDNVSGAAGNKGKLTLRGIAFTYNGKNKALKNRYGFYYDTTAVGNPDYAFAAADRWGTFKPQSMNPGGLKNSDFPYAIQDTVQKTTLDQNASAWMLRRIVLPSGGQLDMSYESDDYAFVQNKRSADMMKVAGFGSTPNFNTASDLLYPATFSSTENDYVFVQVPVACSNATEVYNRYLQGLSQLAFKIWVQMSKGPEYITCYATIDGANYGVDGTNRNIIWVKLNRLGGKSPLSLTALEFLRQQLPGQAFTGYDVSGEPLIQQVGDMLKGMLQSLRNAFADPVNTFRKEGKAMHTDLSKCFVRLNDPDGFKYGGGYRVKSVVLSDNWNKMTGQYTATYGQKYEYTTTESFNGSTRRISSGVASYEPFIGGEENPFQTIMQVEDYLPAGPTSYSALEMPVLDAFFPAPVVGYSKVTVTAIKTDTSSAKKSRSGIGKQVTEYYTAKDFPVVYNYTPFDAGSVKEFHQSSTLAFFTKYAYDFKAQSQGFLIATNDMHGKVKSQSSYGENDTATRISYTENFYRNTGLNGLNDKFSFINKDSSGKVYSGNMGVDVDLMTDTREFAVKSSSLEVQGQVDIFYIVAPMPVSTIWPVTGMAQNIYRAVTTTKVVNYHSVLDSVVMIDKGSQVSTKNLAYDAHTGEVLVTRTSNEFNQAIYTTAYPAYWAYSGMGLACKNIDALFSGVNFSDGKIITPFDFTNIESGDELYILSAALPGSGCDAKMATGYTKLLWAFDRNKNNTSLGTTPEFIFLDAKGSPYTMNGVSFRIIRSGRRNMLDAKVATVTSMANPLATGKLFFDTASKVINAGAVEFKEKWQTDNDVFSRYRLVKNPVTCLFTEVPDSLGYLEKKINPYSKGLAGNFHSYRNMVFYDSRKEYDTTANTNLAANGFLKNFKPYWNFNATGYLMPDTLSTQWVWNSRLMKVNAKGLELETQDALGIYTAAQYGYKKTLPVAIGANTRYTEMFADGFEDYGYDESISNAQYNFFTRHIDFRNASNSFLVKTDTANFAAHSGRYVLGVKGSATATLPLSVLSQPDVASGPVFTFQKDTTKVLSSVGGNYTFTTNVPKIVPAQNQGTANFSNGFTLSILPMDTFYTNGTRMHYYTQSGNFYINVTTANTYSFNVSLSTAYNNSGVTTYSHSNGFAIFIADSLGNNVSNYSIGQNDFNYTTGSYTAFLCPGTYQVSFSATELYNATNNGSTGTSNTYSWSCSNGSFTDYRDLTKVNGCIFTKPVSATAEMQNPVFALPASKKMLFSAWVRENCGNPANGIPCKDYTYTHNQVQIKFGGSAANDVLLSPTGAIIDGWQRYEGAFLVPPGATAMTLNLVNSGTTPIYFDDIRIHPFNANLKSYVYDPINLRLTAELDANNYARFYEYDEAGVLVRTKAETREGVKTLTETRSVMQTLIK